MRHHSRDALYATLNGTPICQTMSTHSPACNGPLLLHSCSDVNDWSAEMIPSEAARQAERLLNLPCDVLRVTPVYNPSILVAAEQSLPRRRPVGHLSIASGSYTTWHNLFSNVMGFPSIFSDALLTLHKQQRLPKPTGHRHVHQMRSHEVVAIEVKSLSVEPHSVVSSASFLVTGLSFPASALLLARTL